MIDISNIFLNDTYRKLIDNGRTYASFTTDELKIIFNERSTFNDKILDPMSGYGGLMNHCNPLSISTINLELNLPAYYWQILVNPCNKSIYEELIHILLESKKNKYPKIRIKAKASDNWFTNEGLDLTKKLLTFVQNNLAIIGCNNFEISIALLLPFVKRLSTCITGDITHLKKGGITVFENWEYDFLTYLKALQENRLNHINQNESTHKTYLGDIRNFAFPEKYSLVVTSPPYPNYRDYYKMFAPENFFLENLGIKTMPTAIIGSNVIKGRFKGAISSEIALKFLKELEDYKGSKKASNDIKVYYLPYFHNYFSDIESSCNNIILHLNRSAVCYFSIVNNATRNFTIPVAQVIEEIFKKRGFQSEYVSNKEVFHVGTKNPNSRGLKAKHNKFLIKLWR